MNHRMNKSSLGTKVREGITGRGSHMDKMSRKHKMASCRQGQEVDGALKAGEQGLMTKGRSLF